MFDLQILIIIVRLLIGHRKNNYNYNLFISFSTIHSYFHRFFTFHLEAIDHSVDLTVWSSAYIPTVVCPYVKAASDTSHWDWRSLIRGHIHPYPSRVIFLTISKRCDYVQPARIWNDSILAGNRFNLAQDHPFPGREMDSTSKKRRKSESSFLVPSRLLGMVLAFWRE